MAVVNENPIGVSIVQVNSESERQTLEAMYVSEKKYLLNFRFDLAN
jgi:hypothetical protein